MTTAQRVALKAQIRRWMRANVEDYVDGNTGEVDCTGLVEAWDRACASGGDTLDPDHPAWDVAVQVSDARDAAHGQGAAA